MAIVKVTALKDFTYSGREFAAGELVPMEVVDASIAKRRGQVSLDRGLNARTLAAAETSEPATEQPPKRRYRRRDMVAEP